MDNQENKKLIILMSEHLGKTAKVKLYKLTEDGRKVFLEYLKYVNKC